MRKGMFAGHCGSDRKQVGGSGVWKGEIDTRLVAAVQARAGSRVHEAAGLLNSYYLWSGILARADRMAGDSNWAMAVEQVGEAKRRLKEFLTKGVWGWGEGMGMARRV